MYNILRDIYTVQKHYAIINFDYLFLNDLINLFFINCIILHSINIKCSIIFVSLLSEHYRID